MSLCVCLEWREGRGVWGGGRCRRVCGDGVIKERRKEKNKRGELNINGECRSSQKKKKMKTKERK